MLPIDVRIDDVGFDRGAHQGLVGDEIGVIGQRDDRRFDADLFLQEALHLGVERSEEHTSELQSLMRISYAVFCFKKKSNTIQELVIRIARSMTFRTNDIYLYKNSYQLII